jgi:hypothetical protein
MCCSRFREAEAGTVIPQFSHIFEGRQRQANICSPSRIFRRRHQSQSSHPSLQTSFREADAGTPICVSGLYFLRRNQAVQTFQRRCQVLEKRDTGATAHAATSSGFLEKRGGHKHTGAKCTLLIKKQRMCGLMRRKEREGGGVGLYRRLRAG